MSRNLSLSGHVPAKAEYCGRDQNGRKQTLPHSTDRLALHDKARQNYHPTSTVPRARKLSECLPERPSNKPHMERARAETRDPDRETRPLGICTSPASSMTRRMMLRQSNHRHPYPHLTDEKTEAQGVKLFVKG